MSHHSRFKEVALFVAGSTPQIITETICALALRSPSVVLDEIYIITTTVGRTKIRESLIADKVLENLTKEYTIQPITLADGSFVIPRDSLGNEIEDIRTDEENEAMGDTITAFIREKTADQSTRLHCSLAGGRKTMSFYLGAALQLFGRPWDKLYHVLVSPEFESNPSFFYKPKRPRLIECRLPDGTIKKLSTKDAKIHLAELPFIRLRDKLALHGKGFRELVDEGQTEVDIAAVQPELTVNLQERTIYIGTTLIEMVPMQLLLYIFFLRQKTEHCKYPDRPYCLDCTGCFQTVSELSTRQTLIEMTGDYAVIYGGAPLKREELLHKWPDGLGMPAIRGDLSKINKTIKDQIDSAPLVPYYSITTVKRYGDSRYGVRVEKSKIRIE